MFIFARGCQLERVWACVGGYVGRRSVVRRVGRGWLAVITAAVVAMSASPLRAAEVVLVVIDHCCVKRFRQSGGDIARCVRLGGDWVAR